MKSALYFILLISALGLGFVARKSLVLVVPKEFKGLIKVVEAKDGVHVGLLLPEIRISSAGVARIDNISRFSGLCWIRARFSDSGETIPTARDTEIKTSTVLRLWQLPRSINQEAYFFVGSYSEYEILIGNRAFIQELGRDRRNEENPFGNDLRGEPIKR